MPKGVDYSKDNLSARRAAKSRPKKRVDPTKDDFEPLPDARERFEKAVDAALKTPAKVRRGL